MLRVSHLMAIHSPQDTHKVYWWLSFYFFSPYQLVWCLCCQYECDYLSPCCLDMLIPSLSNKGCLQCWKLSLNLVQDPPCPLCTRESECCSQCPQLEIQWLQWSENRQEMHKAPNYALQHCWKWAWNALLPSVARSGLECRKDSKEVMGKRVLAVMDGSFVFTCSLLPGN